MSKKVFDIAKKRAVERETSKFFVSAQPFMLMVVILFLAIIFNLIWGTNQYLSLVVLFIVTSTIGLSILTWNTSKKRKSDESRVQSVINMASTGFWLAYATAMSPFSRPAIDFWILGGLVLAFAWNIRNAVKSGYQRITDVDKFFEQEGIYGAKMKTLSRTASKFKALIKLSPGRNTVDDLKKLKPKFASLFSSPSTGIRVDADPDNASQGYVTVVKKDMLKKEIMYPHSNEPRYKVEDPIRLGLYEDAEIAEFSMHSKQLGASHLLIQGMNGSGKSAGALVMFAEIFRRKNVISWVIDTVKGSQTLFAAKNGIDWIIGDEPTANALFKRFKEIIRARANHLGSLRLDKWKEGCGLSFLHIHIEEASGLIANNPAFIKMMETARSVGIQITASLQRATYLSIDTSARAQFSSVLCFGVASDKDALFALPRDVISTGANPAAWRNSKPGYAYLVAPRTDATKWTTPLRTYLMDIDELSKIADEVEKEPLDAITREAVGEIYKTTADDVLDDIEDVEEEFIDPVLARHMLLEAIEDFKDEGRIKFTAPDLKEVMFHVGKSRAWMHKELQRLVDLEILRREGYDYIIK